MGVWSDIVGLGGGFDESVIVIDQKYDISIFSNDPITIDLKFNPVIIDSETIKGEFIVYTYN